jgi:hypothetical protein
MAHDVLVELKWIAEAGAQAGAPQPVVAHRKTRELLSWALVTALSILVAALAAVHFSQRPREVHPVRFGLSPPVKVAVQPDVPAISPDGQRLVFSGMGPDGRNVLWLRSLDSLAAQPLAGTEGASLPFWSPDSRYVAFFSETDRKLKKIGVSGGPVQTICDVPTASAARGIGRVILLAQMQGTIHRVPAAGGEPEPLLGLDKSHQELSHSWPAFCPMTATSSIARETPIQQRRVFISAPLMPASHASSYRCCGNPLTLPRVPALRPLGHAAGAAV